MADGTALLDASGNFILDASGNRILSDGDSDCECCRCYDVWHYDCGSETVNWVSVSCQKTDPAGTNAWNWTGSVYEYIQRNGLCKGADAGNCTPSETPPDPPGDTSNCGTPCLDCPDICVELHDETNALVCQSTMSLTDPGTCYWQGSVVTCNGQSWAFFQLQYNSDMGGCWVFDLVDEDDAITYTPAVITADSTHIPLGTWTDTDTDRGAALPAGWYIVVRCGAC